MSPANLTFTSLPSADTCTRYTVTWNYTGPQQKFTLAVGPLSSQGVTSMYRVLVTDVDATSQAWTWTSVNVTQGLYIFVADGTGVGRIEGKSTAFLVNTGADVSCLDAESSSSTSYGSSTSAATSTARAQSGVYPMLLSSRADSSHRHINAAAIAGGVVGGFAALCISSLLVYHIWRRRAAVFPPRGETQGPRRTALSTTSAPQGADKYTPRIQRTLKMLPALPRLEPNRRAPSNLAIYSPGPEPSSISPQVPASPSFSAPLSPPPPPRDEHLPSASLPVSNSPPWSPVPSTPNPFGSGASEVGSRHLSFASSQWVRDADSPAPSSATSQMYRVRDSAQSEWGALWLRRPELQAQGQEVAPSSEELEGSAGVCGGELGAEMVVHGLGGRADV